MYFVRLPLRFIILFWQVSQSALWVVSYHRPPTNHLLTSGWSVLPKNPTALYTSPSEIQTSNIMSWDDPLDHGFSKNWVNPAKAIDHSHSVSLSTGGSWHSWEQSVVLFTFEILDRWNISSEWDATKHLTMRQPQPQHRDLSSAISVCLRSKTKELFGSRA